MKQWTRWIGVSVMLGCLGASMAAETYHRMPLRDLAFVKGQEELEGAIENSVSTSQIGALRTTGEAYLAGIVAEGADRQWNWKQGNLDVVFRCEDSQKLQGMVDLRPENRTGLKGFAFSMDPATAKACTKEEFEAVKKAHYVRLRNDRLAGKAWFRHQAGGSDAEPRARWRQNDLDGTFAVFSGGRAISENLALDRDLILATGKEGDEKRVKLEEIQGVTVKAIDWKERLPETEVPVDVLSLAIPLDQHAMFCPSLTGMLDLVKRMENEGAPMVQAYTVRNPFRTLASKYRSQMGLDLPDMAARLLPVKSVAVTGGDPFFPLGSDVAVLFETDKPDFLFQALLKSIELRAGKMNATAKEWKGEGFEHRGFETDDRIFSSHLMRRGNLVVVSNSLRQLKYLSRVGSEVPALGASEEYRFFRHRYPLGSGESAFVFLSDATIRRWAGPVSRIGASRRTRALAAMSELNSRLISGEEPGDEFADLLGEFTVDARQVRSARYGTVNFLTPVGELGIESASKSEKEAYERWRRGYEMGWSQVFDPIALRIDVLKGSRKFDLTVLPLTVGSDYQEMMDLAGKSKLSEMARTVPEDSLLYLAMAVDRKSPMFENFDQELPGMLPGLKVNPLGWVGESISITLEDGFFWRALAQVGMEEEMLLHMPLIVRVESGSRLKLAAFLTGVRAAAETSAPDLLSWQVRKHGGKSYVAVSGNEDDIPEGLGIYYAALSKALLISLDEQTLKHAMDREIAGPDENTAVPIEDARHLLMETRPEFLLDYGALVGGPDMNGQRQLESWRALPVLNDWHRLFPDTDPVVFHRDAFGVDLFCPGARGYRWNKEALTMESVAYGHPASPRDEGKDLPLIGKFGTLRAGMEFADGGLRLRLAAEPEIKGDRKKPESPPVGKLLATAAELSPLTVGMVTQFKGRGNEGPETMRNRITQVEQGNGFVTIITETTYEMDGEKYKSTHQNRLHGALRLHEASDDESRTVYDVPEMDLPEKLFEGMQKTYPFSANTEYMDEEFEAERTIGEFQLKVIGLEGVEVPAGKYEDCIRIESTTKTLSGDIFTAESATSWYAKGVGLVKYELNSAGHRTVMELVESH